MGRRLHRGATVAWLVGLALLSWGAPGADAASPIDLGAADPFAVLAGTTVTSAGVSTITGDLGVSPGTAVTGFGPGIGTVSGAIHANSLLRRRRTQTSRRRTPARWGGRRISLRSAPSTA